MRKLTGLVLALVIFAAVTLFTSSKPYTMHSIEGTWELEHFYNYENDEIVDTVPLAEGYRQVKMYYDGRIMWSRTTTTESDDPDGNDVIGRFGYGSYKITNDELIETIEYGDVGMMRALDTMRVFTFELVLGEDTYSQISYDEDGHRTFSENYKRVD